MKMRMIGPWLLSPLSRSKEKFVLGWIGSSTHDQTTTFQHKLSASRFRTRIKKDKQAVVVLCSSAIMKIVDMHLGLPYVTWSIYSSYGNLHSRYLQKSREKICCWIDQSLFNEILCVSLQSLPKKLSSLAPLYQTFCRSNFNRLFCSVKWLSTSSITGQCYY